MAHSKNFRAYLLALLAWGFAFFLALKVGAAPDIGVDIIMQLRLPRAIAATAIGIGLAVSGAALQALFANPLCEPYTLGISSGSALGAVLGISLGLEWHYAGLAGSAFMGALLFAGILYLISLRSGVGNLGLLLAGVMLGFLGSSLVALWMALVDSNGIQSATLWLMGNLSRARIEGSILMLVGSLILSFVLWMRWKDLDALLMGEEGAAALGVSVSNARRWVVILVSLLVGLCVSGGGIIGFIGLVVPHLARKLVGSLHFRLLPLCAIWGAAALTSADALSRVIVRPYELPVGVVTALAGAPLFIWIMLKKRTAIR